VDRFEGLLPVVEDWHARMISMKVSYNYEVIRNKKIKVVCRYHRIINE